MSDQTEIRVRCTEEFLQQVHKAKGRVSLSEYVRWALEEHMRERPDRASRALNDLSKEELKEAFGLLNKETVADLVNLLDAEFLP